MSARRRTVTPVTATRNNVENLVTMVTGPIPVNIYQTRDGPVPQFAITRKDFENITNSIANMIVSNPRPLKSNKNFKRVLSVFSSEIGKGLGLLTEWGQNRKYFIPFTVPKKNTYTPMTIYNNRNGTKKGVVGIARNGTGRKINLTAAGLKFPFTGTGRTLPLGTIKIPNLQQGVPEVVVPAGTKFVKKTKTEPLGTHLIAKIKNRSRSKVTPKTVTVVRSRSAARTSKRH